MRRLALLLLLLATGGCAAKDMTLTDHPLAGRVWDVAAQRFIEPAEAERRIAAADIALLGETHDNAVHHAIQEKLLRRALEVGRRPALVMEQIDTEWQSAVDAACTGKADTAAVAEAGKVGKGWRWPQYEPIVALALEHRLPIVAANLSRTRARVIAADGLATLGVDEDRRLGLAQPWPAPRRAQLRQVLVDGHCGEDSPFIDKLVDVQRARDAVMADNILKVGDAGAVAIIGRGHARADFGVPLYLALRAPQRQALSLGLVEVSERKESPADYADARPGQHDLVWFTPRAARADPCEGFKPPVEPKRAEG